MAGMAIATEFTSTKWTSTIISDEPECFNIHPSQYKSPSSRSISHNSCNDISLSSFEGNRSTSSSLDNNELLLKYNEMNQIILDKNQKLDELNQQLVRLTCEHSGLT